jgi:diacylglycerol kinase (ATP)
MDFMKMLRSFRYAFAGILTLLREENNARFHALSTLMVLILGFYYGVSRQEWMALVFAIVSVWAAEAFNTSIEGLCNKWGKEQDEGIRKIKDLAAAAVLLSALGAGTVGVLIFGPRFLGV